MHSRSSLRCRVTSAWHIQVGSVTAISISARRLTRRPSHSLLTHFSPYTQVEAPGCVVHRILHIQGTYLVLCAYGRATTSATASPPPAGEKTTDALGVLAVDSRDGSIKERVSFPSPCEGETIVWMTASGRDMAAGAAGDADETMVVTVVTSTGSLWRCRFNRSDVTICKAIHYDTLLKGLGSEASPMEDLVLAMGAEDCGQPATNKDGSGTCGSGGTSRDGSSRSSSQTDTAQPEFMSENGYRGIRSGYTYWDGTMGKAKGDTGVDVEGMVTGQQYRAGYYRNDVMRDILAARRQWERGGQPPATNGGQPAANQPQARSQAKTKNNLLRCFLHLPNTSKFVACAHQPEEGTITVGSLDLGPDCTVLNLDGLIGHMSGVLALAASPDEKYVASGSYDQTIRIYETASWTCLKVLKGHGGGIKCLAFSDDGTQLISAASDNTTRVWSTRTWMCMRQLHGRHEDATWPVCQAFATHAAEKLLLSGSNGLFGGSTLKIFDVTSGDCLATFAQLRFDQKGSCSAAGFASRQDSDGVGLQEVTTLTAVTAATDASLAGWVCEITREKNTPLLSKGFLCRT